jgi:5-methylcytosine-specific restriction endonuclease McrA
MPKKGADSKADYQKYRSWYIARETSKEGLAKRSERAQARTKAVKEGKLSGPHDPRTVDHVRPLSKGGGNSAGNLRAVSATANRRKFNHT